MSLRVADCPIPPHVIYYIYQTNGLIYNPRSYNERLQPSAVINQCEFDFDKVSSIHYESEQKPYDTAIITFTDTQLRARVTNDAENHVFLFSIFWWAEPDDPIYTDGCIEYSEAIDFID